jgi:hypothetical protein
MAAERCSLNVVWSMSGVPEQNGFEATRELRRISEGIASA